MTVPFLDLKAQYLSIKKEIDAGIQQVIEKTAFAGGPFVSKFEEEFADYCQTKYAIGSSSGTSALWLALAGLGVGPGDEVITVVNTFIATAEAISLTGAKPVFVDIKQDTYNMDPTLIEAAITKKTKAIIPVHLYGQTADMDPIMKIAKKHGLLVIEDACQAHGAEYKGKKAGAIGDAGCFSFYPGKNLGAYGEAGAIVTNNKELTDQMKMFRDHGQNKKYYHSIVGWNDRMDGIQGAILSVKLKHLENWNNMRIKNAESYNNLLQNIAAVKTPAKAEYARHVYHIYALLTQKRDEMLQALTDKQVYCGIHYPVPLHLQLAYKDLGYKKGDFPVAEKVAAAQISLPMFAELTRTQIEIVVQEIQNFLTN